uniref:Uncharacterized protein n=1 Tax=Arundo donax TaxID=35708 RepID=A0A0A9BRN4_ARUDO
MALRDAVAEPPERTAKRVTMVARKPIDSFFKRKRDEQVVEQEQPLVPAPLIVLENQRQDEVQLTDEPVVFWSIEFLEREIWSYIQKFGSIQATSKMQCSGHT